MSRPVQLDQIQAGKALSTGLGEKFPFAQKAIGNHGKLLSKSGALTKAVLEDLSPALFPWRDREGRNLEQKSSQREAVKGQMSQEELLVQGLGMPHSNGLQLVHRARAASAEQ